MGQYTISNQSLTEKIQTGQSQKTNLNKSMINK